MDMFIRYHSDGPISDKPIGENSYSDRSISHKPILNHKVIHFRNFFIEITSGMVMKAIPSLRFLKLISVKVEKDVFVSCIPIDSHVLARSQRGEKSQFLGI